MNIALPRVLLLSPAVLALCACGAALKAQSTPCGFTFCSAGQVCSSNRCVTPPPPDDGGTGGCQGDSDCAVGRCLLSTGTCVACLSESDCALGTCNQAHACVALPDGCLSAELVDLSQGPVHLSGNLERAADDTHVSCAASAQGNDLVYQLTVPQQGRLVAKVVSDGSFRPAIELRPTCSGTANPLACTHASAALSTTANLQLDPVPAGTYFLWVDSDDGAAGAFTLELSLENPPPADSCSSPTFVQLDDTPLTLSGSTVNLKDDTSGTCGGKGAPDAVFAIRADARKQIRFEVASTTAGYSPIVYVRQACEDASAFDQVACLAGPDQAFTLPAFGPGLLYVFIDGAPNNQLVSAGAFTLTVTPSDAAAPPTNDSCGLAQTLPLAPTGMDSVSVQSDTTAAGNDSSGCFGQLGDDLVYQFHLDVPRLVQVTVKPLLGSGYRPVVYLRPANMCTSEDPGQQVGCTRAVDFGASVTTVVPSLPAGDWFLWVDGYLSDGPFNLQVDTGDPPAAPANDTCVSPAALNVGSGYGTVSGSTLGAADDVSDAYCTYPSGVSSPDVVYGLSLSTPVFLGLDLKAAAGSSLEPVVELRGGTSGSTCTSSEDPGMLIGCNWGDPGVPNRAVYTASSVGPGEYWIWVEGDQASQGDFSLRVVTGPPASAPPNDGCQALATPLAVGSNVSGDTRGAHADALDPALDGAPEDFGPDVVYPLTLSSSSVTLTVTPDATAGTLLRPVVALRTACSDANSTVRVAAGGDYGAPASFTFSNLTPGTYYLWVGGVRQSTGAFTLEVQ